MSSSHSPSQTDLAVLYETVSWSWNARDLAFHQSIHGRTCRDLGISIAYLLLYLALPPHTTNWKAGVVSLPTSSREHGDQLFAIADEIAEQVTTIGETTLRLGRL
jgi:hypothetical protein